MSDDPIHDYLYAYAIISVSGIAMLAFCLFALLMAGKYAYDLFVSFF